MQADMPELQFGVAVAVILFSVSTILDELNLAFQSIVSKTVPLSLIHISEPTRPY